MTILIDADACPVIGIVEAIAKQQNIECILLCDTNHILHSTYSKVKVIGAGTDAVDFAIVNMCKVGDIVVTQDYGLAALVLAKKAYAIHQNGKWYTSENIDQMLMERHLSKKERISKKGKHHLKGPSKRTEEDDVKFRESFMKLIENVKYVHEGRS